MSYKAVVQLFAIGTCRTADEISIQLLTNWSGARTIATRSFKIYTSSQHALRSNGLLGLASVFHRRVLDDWGLKDEAGVTLL